MRKLDGGRSPRQLSLHGDDKVHAPEAHVHARDLANAVASHLWPIVDDETRKSPLPSVPTVSVLNHRLGNF